MGYALQVRISKEEERRYKAAAARSGLGGLSAWAREVLAEAAKAGEALAEIESQAVPEWGSPEFLAAVERLEAFAGAEPAGEPESVAPRQRTITPPCLGNPPALAACHLCGLKHE